MENARPAIFYVDLFVKMVNGYHFPNFKITGHCMKAWNDILDRNFIWNVRCFITIFLVFSARKNNLYLVRPVKSSTQNQVHKLLNNNRALLYCFKTGLAYGLGFEWNFLLVSPNTNYFFFCNFRVTAH